MRKLIVTSATLVGACLGATAHAQSTSPQAPPFVPPVVVSPLTPKVAPHAALGPTAEYYPAPPTLPNYGLIATGALAFAGTYGASAFLGATSNAEWDRRLVYPVVGPWLDLAGRDCAHRQCSASGWDRALLIGDGILQAASVATMALGFAIPTTVTHGAFFFVGDRRVGVAGSF